MTPKYFLELGDIMAHVEASDGALAPIAYDEGIERATALIRGQTAAGRKVIFVGNGGSAAIASHQHCAFRRCRPAFQKTRTS